MEHEFGKGKFLFKSKGFEKAESAHNAKHKALHEKMEGKKMEKKEHKVKY